MRSHCRWPLVYLDSQEIACGRARHAPYLQGFRVRTEQGKGCVSAPAPTSHWEGRTWDWDMSWD